MSIATTPIGYTPEDLLSMPDGDRYELVDGKLVERKMSFWSSYVAGRVFKLVSNYVEPNGLGWPAPEGTSFQCFSNDPGKVRRADTSFIRIERMTVKQANAEGHTTIAPDLAVEVVSPNDLYYDVDEKVAEWLAAGVRLVWVVHPIAHYVRVFRARSKEIALYEEDEITGDDVIPGFRCKVREFFAPPPGAVAGDSES
jgi:Uma2 family endonuclease